MLPAAIQAMRPHQWVKNLFVLAPLLFSHQLLEVGVALRSLAAVFAFCLASSTIYLYNDLHDVEKDRLHPKKRFRPIASGRLPVSQAWTMFWGLLASGLVLGFLLNWQFGMVLVGYLLLNVAYSLKLKEIIFLDVLSIALGFILRVVGGGLVNDIYLSHWLLICTLLLATFLGLGKRKHELLSAREQAQHQRSVLAAYRPATLELLLALVATATMAAYLFYTIDPVTVRTFQGQKLVYTIPCIMLGILRFLQLVDRAKDATSPTEAMLKDPLFVLNVLVWIGMVLTFLYLPV